VETLRSLLAAPGASPVAALERRVGDPAVVVRTLHHLQNAGLVKIEIERATMDLVVRVDAPRRNTLEALLRRIS
jgi:hypothetical protein